MSILHFGRLLLLAVVCENSRCDAFGEMTKSQCTRIDHLVPMVGISDSTWTENGQIGQVRGRIESLVKDKALSL